MGIVKCHPKECQMKYVQIQRQMPVQVIGYLFFQIKNKKLQKLQLQIKWNARNEEPFLNQEIVLNDLHLMPMGINHPELHILY